MVIYGFNIKIYQNSNYSIVNKCVYSYCCLSGLVCNIKTGVGYEYILERWILDSNTV